MVTASGTPLCIGRVSLRVHDLPGVADFYQRVVGLHRQEADGEQVTLGNGRDPLLTLIRDPAARRASPREAGLFHTAFLLPTRADLGVWLRHASDLGLRLDGAADHLVSEAVYLRDPEGNGIELYRDRPSEQWSWQAGRVAMRNEPLDFEGILAEGEAGTWAGVPVDACVGHVHLQVGALEPAERFYREALGLVVTCRFPGAVFYASGGYHHHLATNIWNSRGAGVRSSPVTGLAEVEILRNAPADLAAAAGDVTEIIDPWGSVFSLRSACRPPPPAEI